MKLVPTVFLGLLAVSTSHAAVIATNDFSGAMTAAAGTTSATSAWTDGPDVTLLTMGTTFTSSVNYRNIAGGDGANQLTPDFNIGNPANGSITITFTGAVGATDVDLSSFSLNLYAIAGNGGNQTQTRTGTVSLGITGLGYTPFSTSTSLTDTAGATGNPGGQFAAGTLDLSGAADLAAGQTYTFTLTVADNASGGWYSGVDVFSLSGAAVPEPSAALLGGLGALAFLRRRR